MKEEKYFCDIKDCKKEVTSAIKEIQVIFTTDQTEGLNCQPYLSLQAMNICAECYNKILKGNYLYAHGAQGHNTYYFLVTKPVERR